MTESVITINEECQPNNDLNKKKPKARVVFGVFKAAMFMLRHRTKGKQKAAAQVDWKKLVGSMRPLHLQDNMSNNNTYSSSSSCDASSSPSGTMSQYASADDLKSLDDTMSQYASANDLKSLLDAPDSSSGTMSQYASANDLKSLDLDSSMSQYASANNLQELDVLHEDDPDHVFDAIGADDMIDAKAELFILQFYQQMRRQNIDSMSGQFN